MAQPSKKQSFGTMLRSFRGRTVDRGKGKALSQERLGIKVSEETGLLISRNIVSNWESGSSTLNPQRDRRILTALVAVMYKHEGITSLEDANQLLEAGDYRPLDQEEIEAIAPKWMPPPPANTPDHSGAVPLAQTTGQNATKAQPALIKIVAAEPLPVVIQPQGSAPPPAAFSCLGNALASFLAQILFDILDRTPEWLFGRLFERRGKRDAQQHDREISLIDPACGDRAVNLERQRLKISSAFGSYFTGLIEREYSYIPIQGQVELVSRAVVAELEAFQNIYWSLQYARGAQVILIAAEGGMGKSTLAAKIIRCLYQEEALDLLLGDSAKTRDVDPVTGEILAHEAGYYDPASFLKKVSTQLGLDYSPDHSSQQQAISRIKDRLEGRRAVMVLDNLETAKKGDALLHALHSLAGRDLRILVTARSVSGITHQTPGVFLIHLRPLQDPEAARTFLRWHIHRHQSAHPDLQKIEAGLNDPKHLRLVIEKTGGIPLLMQLAVSDVARSTWARLEALPNLFGAELLDFLYRERWDELAAMGRTGQQAMALLEHVRKQTFRGRVSYADLLRWSKEAGGVPIDPLLQILQERFMILNNDMQHGNYSIFPSLANFLISHPGG